MLIYIYIYVIAQRECIGTFSGDQCQVGLELCPPSAAQAARMIIMAIIIRISIIVRIMIIVVKW